MAEVNRRDFLSGLGLTVGASLAALPGLPSVGVAHAQSPVKGNITDTPYKIGHMTFFTGPAAVLGEPMFKGQQLAADETNAAGGLLGKRKIELLKADENAGTDANVKELRRLKLSEKIDFFCGITSSGNTPALGPVAEELKVLTMFVDGCTDFLFDKAVPNLHYAFRTTNIQSADGITTALAIVQTWPKAKRIAHIHPDYSYGRNAFDHIKIVMKKMMPQAEIVSEGWPKLGTTDFSLAHHQGHLLQARPGRVLGVGRRLRGHVRRPLRYGMFQKAKFATTLALGVAPHALGKDHPEGVIAGAQATIITSRTLAATSGPTTRRSWRSTTRSSTSTRTSRPRALYTTTYMPKAAIEKANRLVGGMAGRRRHHRDAGRHDWPARRATCTSVPTTTRDKDAMIGFSKNTDEYPFPILIRRASSPFRSAHHGASRLAEGRADLDVHLIDKTGRRPRPEPLSRGRRSSPALSFLRENSHRRSGHAADRFARAGHELTFYPAFIRRRSPPVGRPRARQPRLANIAAGLRGRRSVPGRRAREDPLRVSCFAAGPC